jgi:hypothetical protein
MTRHHRPAQAPGRRLWVLAGLAATLLPRWASAQSTSGKTLRIVVPFTPGGSTESWRARSHPSWRRRSAKT